MNGIIIYSKILFFLLAICLQGIAIGQTSFAIDISPPGSYKRVVLFNTKTKTDSIKLLNTNGKPLPKQYVVAIPMHHVEYPEITLFEEEGSALVIDTGGNLLMRNMENDKALPVPLKINIDSLGLGVKNLVIECCTSDMENLVLYVSPASQYKVQSTEPTLKTKFVFKLDEILYGAKGKASPKMVAAWQSQIQINPEDRKVLYDYKLLLPKDMIKRGQVTLMIYDMSHQVVAIYPDLKKTENIIKRDNIMTNTYIYRVFFNGEVEIKKGLIHYLSPENEKKKLEEQSNKTE